MLQLVKGITQLQKGNSSILITDSHQFTSMMMLTSITVYFYACKRCIGYFVTECYFILTIVVIPNVHPTVLSNQEEHSISGWWPTPISQIRAMIFGSHDRGFDILNPNLSTPITNSQEVLSIRGTSVNGTYWSQVATIIHSISGSDFNVFLWFFIGNHDWSLFCTDEELGGSSLNVIL